MYQYPLFETLAVDNGKILNLHYHQERIERSFLYFFKTKLTLNLAELVFSDLYQKGFFRCRLDYSPEGYELTFSNYLQREIKQFQCVYTENLDYGFKYSDRKRLEQLKSSQADEVIIINNGYVSDCTIGNLLFLKKGKWYSPADYLLKGTQLSALLAEKAVSLTRMKVEDLWGYEAVMHINALNPFEEARAIAITSGTILR